MLGCKKHDGLTTWVGQLASHLISVSVSPFVKILFPLGYQVSSSHFSVSCTLSLTILLLLKYFRLTSHINKVVWTVTKVRGRRSQVKEFRAFQR